ncbi:MAG: type II toxin-antitoxin system VapC family toxin [Desulfobacterales bacterium]|nr:type II toxin-antitoxin system VapC family toxin [Desulfobacterales bacterium]
MKVLFDTNVYISFIRNRTHSAELQRRGTVKYLSAIVLMELWAGSRGRRSERLLHQLQRPYRKAGRIVLLTTGDYITAGQFFSDLPSGHKELCKKADFINDVQIAVTALSIGATLYTENRAHFNIIQGSFKQLKVAYLEVPL